MSQKKQKTSYKRKAKEIVPPTLWQQHDSKVALTLVFYQLDVISLCTSIRVCKLWYDIVAESFVWSLLFEKYFGRWMVENSNNTDWKKEFQREYQNVKEIGKWGGNNSNTFVYFSHSIHKKTLSVPEVRYM